MAEDNEMEESEMSESGDRLSDLPHSLIFHIFSFLPMKNVVSTTLLSRRWKNLWTTSPCLNFCKTFVDDYDYDYERYADRFRNFVNRALIFWKGPKIMKFRIDYEEHFDMSLAKDVDVWVCFAKENNVEELNIDLTYLPEASDWDNAITDSKKDIYRAPECLNSCSSIKTLSLVNCNLRIPKPPLWYKLKSLRIDGFCFSERMINRVLCGAPQLEVFILRLLDSNENLNIRSTSLKKLKIEKYLYFDWEIPITNTVLRIGCPNLEMLEVSGILYCMWLLTNVSSLTDATLGFDVSHHYDDNGLSGTELLGNTLGQIIPNIRHVEKVTLSDWCFQALGASRKKYLLSPLSNVKWLKLDVRSRTSIQPDEMVHVLGVFPDVKTLVIKDLSFFRNDFTGFETDLLNYNLSKLRTIEVTTDLHFIRKFPLLEFLLKHASMLEKMVIRYRGLKLLSKEYRLKEAENLLEVAEKLLKATEKLLSMPRSSPTAKVILLEK